MAQTITTNKTYGIGKAFAIALEAITDETVSIDMGGAKAPVTILLDVPSGDYVLKTVTIDGKEKDIMLNSASLNTVKIDTLGIKAEGGFALFKLCTVNGASAASAGIKMCVLAYTPVVNH